jgi:hypothetical protein
MHEKAEEFKKSGGKIYQEVDESRAGEVGTVVLRAAPKEE